MSANEDALIHLRREKRGESEPEQLSAILTISGSLPAGSLGDRMELAAPTLYIYNISH